MAAKKGGLNIGKGLQALIPRDSDAIAKKNTSAEGFEEIANSEQDNKKDETAGKSEAKKEKKVSEKSDTQENKSNSSDKKNQETKTDELEDYKVIEVRNSLVIPNPDQPRKEFDEAAIAELAESIRIYGVIQPLLVQKKGRYYEIISGERRWRASKIAGLKSIPVIVREYSGQETVEVSLIENIQRQNLNPVEEAWAYKRLVDEFGLTQADIAKRVSKSRTAITNTMRLLNLEERVQHMIVDQLISAGHARTLLALEDKEIQNEVATRIVTDGLSVRDTEKLIQKMKRPPKEEKEKDEQVEAVYSSIEERLKGIIGTKVSIKRKKKITYIL